MSAYDPTTPDLPLPGASFGVAFRRFWQRSLVFSGRASRSEYWWAALANGLLGLALYALTLGLLLGGSALNESGSGAAVVLFSLGGVFGLLLVLFGLAQIVASIALGVRRLHDANFSGLLYLLALIPYLGGLILLILNLLPSDPAGRRFDRGATAWVPQPGRTPPQPTAAAVPARPSIGALDAWPAPEPRPATAPLPAQSEPPGAADCADPLRTAWGGVGAVTAVDPRFSGQPSWRRIGYLLVDRTDGIGVLTTHGLAASEGAAALGPGADVYVASTALAGRGGAVADGWEFALLASVARRIGASGMHLPAELGQHRVLSMAVPVPSAPAEWRAPDGAVGVLLGVPTADVPESVVTPAGEVRLIGVVPLRPTELERILAGGAAAREAIAGDLAALPPAQLASPARPPV